MSSAPPTPTTLVLPPVPSAASSSSAQHPPPPHPQIPIQGGAQSTAPGAQLPTLTNTHIRSVADAQKLFYAVQLGLLPKVERRLDAVERKRLQPGDVYVWEERGSGPGFVAQGSAVAATAAAAAHKVEGGEGAPQGYEVGIERWTEGLSWSASRIREYVVDPSPASAFLSPISYRPRIFIITVNYAFTLSHLPLPLVPHTRLHFACAMGPHLAPPRRSRLDRVARSSPPCAR